MHLRQVQISNFRAFRNVELTLPETGLVLIAGANNSGKTALLSALDLIAGNVGDLTSLRYGGAEQPAHVAATFELDLADRAKILGPAANSDALLRDGALGRIQFLFTELPGFGVALTQVEAVWPGAMLLLGQARPDSSQQGLFRQEWIAGFPGGAITGAADTARQITTIGQPGLENALIQPPLRRYGSL